MVLLNLLVKPIYIFAIDRNVQNVVGYEQYGLYAALLNLSIIFNILLDLGITNFNNKSLAEDPKRIKTYLPNMLISKGLLSLLFIGVVLIVGLTLDYNVQSITFLLLIALIQLLNSLLLFLRSNVSAHHDFKIDSVLSIADKLIMIMLCSVLLFHPVYKDQFKIEWFIYAQLAAYGVSILAALAIILIRYSKLRLATFQVGIVKKIVKQSFPYALLILLMGLYTRVDSVLLERMLQEDGDYQNGMYVSAYRILDALNMFGFLFAGMLLPMFSRMLAKNNKVKGLVRTTTNILVPISLVVVANALFFNSEIMNTLYAENTMVASTVYRFVMLTFPAYCIMNIYSTLLTANGSLRLLITIAAIACIISIGANTILIPSFKALSVAWVAVGVQWFVAICYMIFSIRETDIEFNWPWIFQFVFFFMAFCMVNYLFKSVNIGLWLAIVLNMVIFVPLVFMVRLWNWQDLTKYFQEMVVKDKQ